MNKAKQEKLEKAGWKVGTVAEFLGLTEEEEAFIELKSSLSAYLQEKRKTKNLTQVEMAQRISSSQSRVAKMEKADTSVSLDLIVRSLLSLGAGPRDIARCISTKRSSGGRMKAKIRRGSKKPKRPGAGASRRMAEMK
jgi:predicted XRE-type DNA-binding protein